MAMSWPVVTVGRSGICRESAHGNINHIRTVGHSFKMVLVDSIILFYFCSFFFLSLSWITYLSLACAHAMLKCLLVLGLD